METSTTTKFSEAAAAAATPVGIWRASARFGKRSTVRETAAFGAVLATMLCVFSLSIFLADTPEVNVGAAQQAWAQVLPHA